MANPVTAEPIALAIHCPKCGNAMTVVLQPIARLGPRRQPAVHDIACPHGCGATLHPKFYGEVEAVWAGHGQQPEPVIVH